MTALPPPARYIPFRKGKYEVSPGLLGLGADFGNGPADRLLFQLDSDFHQYRQAKLQSRAERLDKYYGTSGYSPEVAAAVASLIIARLTEEHPSHFHLEQHADGTHTLHCALTHEHLRFDADLNLIGAADGEAQTRAGEASSRGAPPSARTPRPARDFNPSLASGERDHSGLLGSTPSQPGGSPPYTSALDALACQVQDDLAVMSLEGDRNWVSAVHVCCPSGWVPVEKLGLDYRALHAPVPGMAALNPVAHKLVDAMVHRGPYVRFVWGVYPTSRLNRHPEPPPGVTLGEWKGTYDWTAPSPFVVRVERQCLWPLPEVGASLFLIRLSFVAAENLEEEHRAQLRAGLLSMSPESREYKGLTGCFDRLTAWLADPPGC